MVFPVRSLAPNYTGLTCNLLGEPFTHHVRGHHMTAGPWRSLEGHIPSSRDQWMLPLSDLSG